MSTHLLSGRSKVWPRLRDLATRPRSTQALAAIAYLGVHAPQLLPLRQGDIMICDASDESVRLGLTNVAALAQYMDSGVQVYSRAGLHAKAGVIGRWAFAGSANASATSDQSREEAAMLTTDAVVRQELRAYIKGLRDHPSRELGPGDLKRLGRLPVRAPRWPGHPASQPVLQPPGRLWLCPWEYDEFETHRERRRAARIAARKPIQHHRSDRLEMTWVEPNGHLSSVRVGDYLSWSAPGAGFTYTPARVEFIDNEIDGMRWGVYYLERGDLRRRLPTTRIQAAIRTVSPGWSFPANGAPARLTAKQQQAVAALPWAKAL